MNNELKLSAEVLAKGALQRVEDGRGTWVQCLEGRLWLTQQGMLRDIVLEAGDEVQIERDGTSILSALSDARFVLLRPTPSLTIATRSGASVKLAAHV